VNDSPGEKNSPDLSLPNRAGEEDVGIAAAEIVPGCPHITGAVYHNAGTIGIARTVEQVDGRAPGLPVVDENPIVVFFYV
jgi:hypothetical protein